METKLVPDYTDGLDSDLVRKSSPLNDFPFTDSLSYDQQYETDAQGTLTGGLIRTTRAKNRAQLAKLNPLGGQQDGLYFFTNNILTTFLSEATLAFMNAAGTAIAGFLQINAGKTTVTLDAPSFIALTAPRTTTNVIAVADPPAAGDPPTLAGFAQIYIAAADNDLKVIFADGTVKTIVTD